jgi:hypothetical protein
LKEIWGCKVLKEFWGFTENIEFHEDPKSPKHSAKQPHWVFEEFMEIKQFRQVREFLKQMKNPRITSRIRIFNE